MEVCAVVLPCARNRHGFADPASNRISDGNSHTRSDRDFDINSHIDSYSGQRSAISDSNRHGNENATRRWECPALCRGA